MLTFNKSQIYNQPGSMMQRFITFPKCLATLCSCIILYVSPKEWLPDWVNNAKKYLPVSGGPWTALYSAGEDPEKAKINIMIRNWETGNWEKIVSVVPGRACAAKTH
jgi:hypothetical protein